MPRTLATPRAERAVLTVLRRNRFASLHRIAADFSLEIMLRKFILMFDVIIFQNGVHKNINKVF